MEIINEADHLEMYSNHRVIRSVKESNNIKNMVIDDPVIDEHHMNVFINEQLSFEMVCTPQYLDQLVLGFLFSEGYIYSADDVEYIYICELGQRVKVQLKEEIKLKDFVSPSKSDATACGNNRMFKSGERQESLKKLQAISFKLDSIFMLSDTCNRQAVLFKETGGTHSCAMLTPDGEVLFCEDIGRHNAVDKLIGRALVEEVDLKKCILFTSGRIPSDMVIKVVRSGIPVIASHSAPTGMAVELAKRYNLCLIGFVRGKRINRYSEFSE
ncbi:MAG: FdhD protein [Eubacteriaceae bacterium]|jgi:FdhD protein|nr:FdhD protein [Eubacteriaceae bacterium]MDK2905826.1 FdhD protein [Eubacteriaceae bacterium]MDK2936752.1 FdhD protein [Eubacteriaceae bacterium]MDK2961816.1 FdhD protein [Eubacteriaceae bacterium]